MITRQPAHVYRRRRFTVLIVAGFLLALGLSQIDGTPTQSPDILDTVDYSCHEEDPCWNCAMNGNLICGPNHG